MTSSHSSHRASKRAVFKRFLAIAIGAPLLAISLYVMVGEHMAGVSADATLNARVTTLRAPIEGELTLRVRMIGARVSAQEALGEISDVRVDAGRLADLKRTETNLEADLARVMQMRQVIAKAREEASAYADGYKRGRVNQLQAKLGETKALADAATARLREQENALQRANSLNERGVQSTAILERAQSARDVAQEDLRVAQQRISYIQVELEAAQAGTFLGDSYNDAPYSLQRTRELDLKLAESETDSQYTQHRLQHARELVADELQRVNRLAGAEIRAPAIGFVWNFLANDGEVVRKGQELIRLVDCSSAVITASVSETLYNSLKPGDTGQFRFLGHDRIFEATIMRLAGSGASSVYESMAVKPTPEHLTRYDVTLSAPSLLQDPQLGCSVGRTGRVLFSAGPLAALRRFLIQAGL
jgi:multidrug resistance efflux pump